MGSARGFGWLNKKALPNRLLRTDLTEQKVRPRLKELVDQIFRDVPAGFGGEGLIKTSREELRQVMLKGAHWMVEHGYGWEDDLQHTEATGRLDMPDPDVITQKAIERGKDQLGTLGGGNHFLEIQVVDEIYDPKAAEALGITQKGQITVMIHPETPPAYREVGQPVLIPGDMGRYSYVLVGT